MYPWPTSFTSGGAYPPTSFKGKTAPEQYCSWVTPWIALHWKAVVFGKQWPAESPTLCTFTITSVTTDSYGRITSITTDDPPSDVEVNAFIAGGPGFPANPCGGAGGTPEKPFTNYDLVIHDPCEKDPRKCFLATVGSNTATDGGETTMDIGVAATEWDSGLLGSLVGKQGRVMGFNGQQADTWFNRFPDPPNDVQLDIGRVVSWRGKLAMGDPGYSAQLSSPLSSGSAYTSLSLSATLVVALSSGTSLTLQLGSSSQTVTLSADAAIGASTLSVGSFTANANYSTSTVVNGTTILDDDGTNNGPYVITCEQLVPIPGYSGFAGFDTQAFTWSANKWMGKYFYYFDGALTRKLSPTASGSTTVTVATLPTNPDSGIVGPSATTAFAFMGANSGLYWRHDHVFPWQNWYLLWCQSYMDSSDTVYPNGTTGTWGKPHTGPLLINSPTDSIPAAYVCPFEADPVIDPCTANLAVGSRGMALAHNFCKTPNGLQAGIEYFAGGSIKPTGWDDSRWLCSWDLARFFYDAGVGSSAVGSVDGSGNINASPTMPTGYSSWPCSFSVITANSALTSNLCPINSGGFSPTGTCDDMASTISGGVIGGAVDSSLSGATAYVSLGWTRKTHRRVKHIRFKTYFTGTWPPTDDDAGYWSVRNPSTGYATHTYGGILEDGSVAFITDKYARYCGDNPDDTCSDGGASNVFAYIEIKRTDAEVATMSGTITAVSTGHFETDKSWWGSLRTIYNSVPTSVSTTTVEDTTKLTGYGMGGTSPSQFWTTADRLVGCLLTVSQSSGSYVGPNDGMTARITSQNTSTPSVTFDAISGLSATWTDPDSVVHNTVIKIAEPESQERDKWKGVGLVSGVDHYACQFIWTNPDGSTGACYADNTMDSGVYYSSSTGSTPQVGAKFAIKEIRFGACVNWDGTKWAETAHPFGDEPDIWTMYGRFNHLDILDDTFFNEVKTALDAITAFLSGASWSFTYEGGGTFTNYGSGCGSGSIYGGVTFADIKSNMDSDWSSCISCWADGIPLYPTYQFGGQVNNAYASDSQCCGYVIRAIPFVGGIPTCASHTTTFYGYGTITMILATPPSGIEEGDVPPTTSIFSPIDSSSFPLTEVPDDGTGEYYTWSGNAEIDMISFSNTIGSISFRRYQTVGSVSSTNDTDYGDIVGPDPTTPTDGPTPMVGADGEFTIFNFCTSIPTVKAIIDFGDAARFN